MIANYHTHNELCGHAGGRPEDYTRMAIEKGLQVIGHSDHCPWRGNAFGGRMGYQDLRLYAEDVQRLKTEYGDRIKVLLGGEIEYVPDFAPYYERLLGSIGMDYLILGTHFFYKDDFKFVNTFTYGDMAEEAESYARISMEGMKTGYFKYFCHPDLFFLREVDVADTRIRRAMDIIVDESVKNDYILEINANGFRRGITQYPEGERYPYPYGGFWDLVAQTNIRCIIGSDCHSVDALYDECIVIAERFAADKGLNLIQTLEI